MSMNKHPRLVSGGANSDDRDRIKRPSLT